MSRNIYSGKSVSPYSRTAALLLCLFLGSFGAHQYYVGKSGNGSAILILSLLCGIGSLWALIDFIMILAGSFTDSQGRYVIAWKGAPVGSPQVIVSRPTTQYSPPAPTAETIYRTAAQHLPKPVTQPVTIRSESEENFCSICGSIIKKDEIFCINCGAETQQ